TASIMGVLLGGKRAASSTRRWNSGGTVDTHRTVAHRVSEWSLPSDNRTGEFVMAYYRSVGEVPPKRHTQFRRPDGGLYYEELMGEEGFSSDSSLLYHSGVPSAIVDSQVWEVPDLRTVPNHPLKPRHLKLHDLFPGQEWKAQDVVTGRRLVLGNGDVRISYVAAGES